MAEANAWETTGLAAAEKSFKEITEKAIEDAAKGAAAASKAEKKQEEEDGELTVPIASNSLVDFSMSGKELLGLQDGAGTVNPA